MKPPKRDKDTNKRAFQVVQLAIHEKEEKQPEENGLTTRARAGGLKGGKARAEKLTPEKKSEIAKKAANQRWKK